MTPATSYLFDAITDINVFGVQCALALGADVNARHPLGKLTPLHFACWIHGKRTARALRQSPETEEIALLLLKAGADPTARDGAGDLAKQAGLDSSCHMPAAWAGQGEAPRCVKHAMAAKAAAQTWPEPEVDGTGNPAWGGKVGSHIARGIAFRERRKAAA